MISKIKQYFQEQKVISLYDLSVHFQVEESAMEQILQLLIKKEFIKTVEQKCEGGSCGGCFVSDCHPGKLKIFEICNHK